MTGRAYRFAFRFCWVLLVFSISPLRGQDKCDWSGLQRLSKGQTVIVWTKNAGKISGKFLSTDADVIEVDSAEGPLVLNRRIIKKVGASGQGRRKFAVLGTVMMAAGAAVLLSAALKDTHDLSENQFPTTGTSAVGTIVPIGLLGGGIATLALGKYKILYECKGDSRPGSTTNPPSARPPG